MSAPMPILRAQICANPNCDSLASIIFKHGTDEHPICSVCRGILQDEAITECTICGTSLSDRSFSILSPTSPGPQSPASPVSGADDSERASSSQTETAQKCSTCSGKCLKRDDLSW